MAPTPKNTKSTTRAPRKKKVTGAVPTRRSSRTVNAPAFFSTSDYSGVAKAQEPRAPAAKHKRKPQLTDKVAGAAEKAEGAVTKRPGKKAAGTKRSKGTDGRKTKA